MPQGLVRNRKAYLYMLCYTTPLAAEAAAEYGALHREVTLKHAVPAVQAYKAAAVVIIKEYLVSADSAEVAEALKELGQPSLQHVFVKQARLRAEALFLSLRNVNGLGLLWQASRLPSLCGVYKSFAGMALLGIFTHIWHCAGKHTGHRRSRRSTVEAGLLRMQYFMRRPSCWRWTGRAGSAKWCLCCLRTCIPRCCPRRRSARASPQSCSLVR